MSAGRKAWRDAKSRIARFRSSCLDETRHNRTIVDPEGKSKSGPFKWISEELILGVRVFSDIEFLHQCGSSSHASKNACLGSSSTLDSCS